MSVEWWKGKLYCNTLGVFERRFIKIESGRCDGKCLSGEILG